MREFKIVPHSGVGPIKLGILREEVRAVFGEPEFSRGNKETFLDGFMVAYDEQGKVEAIQLARTRQFRAIFEGECLHELPADVAVEHVSRHGQYDRNRREPGYTYVFPDLDLSLWRGTLPGADQGPDDPEGRYFEAVVVGVDGYFAAEQ